MPATLSPIDLRAAVKSFLTEIYQGLGQAAPQPTDEEMDEAIKNAQEAEATEGNSGSDTNTPPAPAPATPAETEKADTATQLSFYATLRRQLRDFVDDGDEDDSKKKSSTEINDGG